ncbi:MAG: hypothetical protein GY915_06930 [bacterium]|nr:hypothetical protein [bacterium]
MARVCLYLFIGILAFSPFSKASGSDDFCWGETDSDRFGPLGEGVISWDKYGGHLQNSQLRKRTFQRGRGGANYSSRQLGGDDLDRQSLAEYKKKVKELVTSRTTDGIRWSNLRVQKKKGLFDFLKKKKKKRPVGNKQVLQKTKHDAPKRSVSFNVQKSNVNLDWKFEKIEGDVCSKRRGNRGKKKRKGPLGRKPRLNSVSSVLEKPDKIDKKRPRRLRGKKKKESVGSHSEISDSKRSDIRGNSSRQKKESMGKRSRSETESSTSGKGSPNVIGVIMVRRTFNAPYSLDDVMSEEVDLLSEFESDLDSLYYDPTYEPNSNGDELTKEVE